jgi:drug/metabolite transporter (DMT)-like permease
MRILKTDNMIGAAFMCGSMAGFAFNDATVKSAVSEIGIYQAIFIRGLFTVLLIGAFALASGTFRSIPNRPDHKLIVLRSIAEVGGTMTFLTALVHMPIANITAILQVLPLTISIAAAIFMREYFGWRRAAAILIGFIGILIIVRPGADGFNAYALFGLAAVGFVTWRDLIVRQFSTNVSSLYVSFFTAVIITTAGGIATVLLGEWRPIPTRDLALLALAAAFLFVGYYASVAAMRVGEVASVTPFRYSIMLWAILLGWVIWGDIPDGWTLVGMTIVITTGAYTLWRERIN